MFGNASVFYAGLVSSSSLAVFVVVVRAVKVEARDARGIQGSPEAHRIEHLPQVRERCSAGREAALQEVGGREGRILRGVCVGPVWHARHRGWELVYGQCDMQKDCCGIRVQYYCRWDS